MQARQCYWTSVLSPFFRWINCFFIRALPWTTRRVRRATITEAAFICGSRRVCVYLCVLVCNPGALWEGWLINILSREAGLGGIYLRGLFCSWNVPHAFNNSTGIFFFSLLPLDTVPNIHHLGVKDALAFTAPEDADRRVTHQWDFIYKAVYLWLYICLVLYFWIIRGSQCPWTGSIFLRLEQLDNSKCVPKSWSCKCLSCLVFLCATVFCFCLSVTDNSNIGNSLIVEMKTSSCGRLLCLKGRAGWYLTETDWDRLRQTVRGIRFESSRFRSCWTFKDIPRNNIGIQM